MRFVNSLERRLDLIDDHIDRLERGAGALDEVRTLFQTLGGLGGTYGFPAISESALNGATMCVAIREGAELDAGMLRKITHQLRRECIRELGLGPAFLAEPTITARVAAAQDALAS
jgi:hypothetical protein